jgi:hypothetical protein
MCIVLLPLGVNPIENKKYISRYLLTSVVDVGEWSIKCPGRFRATKERQNQLKGRLDGPQSPSGRFWRRHYIFSLSGFVPRTVQSVDSVNTDCTIPAIWFTGYLHNLNAREPTVTAARHEDPVTELTIRNPQIAQQTAVFRNPHSSSNWHSRITTVGFKKKSLIWKCLANKQLLIHTFS